MRVDERVPKFLALLRSRDPKQYAHVVKCILSDRLNLTPDEIERIERAEYPAFEYTLKTWLLPAELRRL